MEIKTLNDINFENKKVLVRVDFNVPLKDGVITDDTRMQGALPTLKHILAQKGSSVILMSHLGRPTEEREPQFSLKQLVEHLQKISGVKTHFIDDCIGDKVKEAAQNLPAGEILLLENTRYYGKKETKNDLDFAKELASIADVYVNDAFGTAHRAHASTEGVTRFLPSVAGLLMQKECEFFNLVLRKPEHPFVAIIGGAKVSSKLSVLESLLDNCDTFIIGGGMSYTFNKALGFTIGTSLVEDDLIDTALAFLEKAKSKGVEVILPIDYYVSDDFSEHAEAQLIETQNIPADKMGMDIGPKTVELLRDKIAQAQMVVWNGPVGVFEFDNFAKGTSEIAKMVAECKGKTIVGGGDSVAAVNKFHLAERIDHVSTGGGASLEYLEGIELPGVVALQK